jgi:ABC-2 type transport system ATP-binding protein
MLIETHNLRKTFSETVAVDSLTLSVGAGEVFGFMGPNGAGKTTTIKMLLGLVAPTAGEARLLDHRPGDPTIMDRVGFLPEQFRFPAWLTAADFLDVHGRLYGLPAAERRARIPRLLARVGLADRADHLPTQLSGGEMQRVAVARALANDPVIILADEPTANLDVRTGAELIELLCRLKSERGITVISATHDMKMLDVSDRILWIRDGKVSRLEERRNLDINVGGIG